MKQIRNVVVVCDYAFFEGGAANVALKTALALSEHTSLNIYCFAGSGDTCKELLTSRVKTIALGLPDLKGNKNKIDAFIKGIYNKKVEKEMDTLLSSLNPEETIIHIHSWTKILSSAVFRSIEKNHFPVFLTIHDYFLACPNGACYDYVHNKICEKTPLSSSCVLCNCDSRSYPQKLWRCLRQIRQNKVIRHNKALNYIFISDYQQKQLIRRLPPINKMHKVKNPINVQNRFKVFAEKNTNYLYIGRLTKEKGPQLFCEAVKRSGVKGVVIGDGILMDELKYYYPDITFLGWMSREDIVEQLKQTRSLIFPTLWYEGSPLTVPEVQAYGIPCIITDCSSATDDIKNGINGEIISANIESLKEAILRFEDNRYVCRLSKNTYEMFDEKRINDKRYVENLISVYNDFIF